MKQLDICDETYVTANPDDLVRPLCDRAFWQDRGVDARPYEDRGPLGRRWTLSGALVGTAELWLEPWSDGTIVHTFVQADPSSSRSDRWLRARFGRPLKHRVLALKADVDAARPAGTSRTIAR